MIQSLQRATMLTALVLLAGCGNDGTAATTGPRPRPRRRHPKWACSRSSGVNCS